MMRSQKKQAFAHEATEFTTLKSVVRKSPEVWNQL